MSMTDRDKKIILAIVPLLILGAYWFVLLSPKREEAGKAAEQLTQAEGRRDTADAQVKQLNGAKASFAKDYATVIRLGKSVPASVDMPSLLVQLDRASKGTGINFQEIKTGQRAVAPGAAAPAAQPPSSKPAQAGAPAAQSGPGQAAQAAGGAVNQSNQSSAKAGASGGNQQAPAGPGGAGGANGANGAAGGSGAPSLESIPLEFTFKGSFFDLADFFHRMKRFVRVANERIVVRGRLLTIDSFSFKSGTSFPKLKAEIKATVYLAPKAEGVSAGASPQGPGQAAPAGQAPQSASANNPPAATVTP